MATTSERTASRLQMGAFMKRCAVAILALGWMGCGVGADESYDGQTLVTSDGYALTAAPGEATPTVTPAVVVVVPQVPANTTAESTGPVADPGTVALPQDPIPVRPNVLPIDPMLAPIILQGGTPSPPSK